MRRPGQRVHAQLKRLTERVPAVFTAAYGLVLLIAWASLGVQVHVLLGERGLLPAQAAIDQADPGFLAFPSPLSLGASDLALGFWVLVGAVLAVAGVARLWPRLTLPLSAFLYLGYMLVGGDFLAFQWDNLLIEAGMLIALLPQKRQAPAIGWLFRLLLFKLYFFSGLAKWQSHLGDWRDGSAMASYYETAPIPTALAYWAHAMPSWWHALESWFALGFELVVPWLILIPRRWAWRAAFVVFTGFQIVNFATANYGFFIPLSVALHLWLLEEPTLPRLDWRLAPVGIWALLSLNAGLARFSDLPASTTLVQLSSAWRVVNSYHLFGHITTERIEPRFEVLDGDWTPLHLHYQPGPVDRAPPFVAPHQPRVDFRLWFYGLSYQRGAPGYVKALVARLCEDPEAVQPLFVEALPAAPEAVRISYWRYRFGDEDWWEREPIDVSGTATCLRSAPAGGGGG